MDLKNRLGFLMLFLLRGGILSKGKTILPKLDLTFNNVNSINNNAIRNSTTPPTLTTTTMKSTTSNIIIVNHEITTEHSLLAQKLDTSKGTSSSEINRTAAYQAANSRGNNSGLPLWAYIVIGVVGLALLVVMIGLAYTKFMRCRKDHGTYMVWDDAELETSPAFTRESEFLLETSPGGQEMVSPELQLYEIPLDSVTHPRIAYIGPKRVAPKRLDEKTKRKDGEFNVPSLTRYKKRDTVYNSVTDTCMTSVMSQGTLDGDGSTSRHTLATVMLSNGGLDKYVSHAHHYDNTSIKGVPRNKSHSMDNNRTQSVSNLIQSRPLPALPINKRFSKSLEKLRFFNTMPVIRPKPSRKLHLPEPSTYTTLVKSASYGSNLQRMVNNNICMDPPAHFAVRKRSLDMQTKMSPQKSTLSHHRKSKSLDTLILLNEIDWNALNVDIYHSYESVHGTKSENGEYESVSDSQPSSPYSENLSQKSPTKSIISSTGNTHDHESIYASVSQEDLQNKNDNGNVNEGNDIGYDSSTMSSLSRDSTCTSPYATVRISQIPGLNYEHDTHEEIYSTKTPEHSGESLETPENSGSTINEIKPSPMPNSARSSTHTYLELFPEDTNRDSIISETSSGYARPVDVIKDIKTIKDCDTERQDKKTSARQSLSNIEIPIETADVFDNETNDLKDSCRTEPGGKEVYDNPVTVCDDERQKDKSKDDIKKSEIEERMRDNPPSVNRQTSKEKHESVEETGENVSKWPTRARSSSEHSECEI